MGTRPRPRYAEPDRLAELIASAIAPLTDELKEVRKDIGKLELNTIARNEVYDRAVMDEKLGKLADEIKSIQNGLTGIKEFVWKALGGASAVVVIFFYLHQYVSIK